MPRPLIKMVSSIKVTDNSAQLARGVAALTKTDVLVGIPQEKDYRDPDPATGKPTAIGNAALAYIHNFGSPTQNIPARPHLEPGILDAEPKFMPYLKAAALEALKGSATGVERNLHAVGQIAVSGVQNKMQTGPFAPLDASTLAARRRRGRTGTKPLIDTAQLLQHYSYVLRPSTR